MLAWCSTLNFLTFALAAALLPAAVWAQPAAALPGATQRSPAPPSLQLKPCRLKGVPHEALCGQLPRPLDPAAPTGTQIQLQVAVLPALARHKRPDAVLFFAGGPGQSAIALAGPLSQQFARYLNRRDLVLIDQRGTGRSAPLTCDAQAPTQPLREVLDPLQQQAQLDACRLQLQKLPHGDLRHYTTPLASADAEAVRLALGLGPVNVVGVSYGTRVVLDYLRQFPQAVRRAVLDGVAPPDMVLPAAFSADAQAALDGLLAACANAPGCQARHPQLGAQWSALLASLPRTVQLPHPVTGQLETLSFSRDMVLGLVRAPLYVPALAAGLPQAVADAAQGNFAGLVGLATALGGGGDADQRLAMGQHFSVICAEDLPRLPTGGANSMTSATSTTPATSATPTTPATSAASSAPTNPPPGADFGDSLARQYRLACAEWPRASVPAAFYQLPTTPVPTLLLSGGQDPVTPPRHAVRTAQALGPLARHVVVPQAGHGVLSLACMRDAVFRFVDADTAAQAQAVAMDCAQDLPRPRVFVPPLAAASATASPVPANTSTPSTLNKVPR